MYIYIYNDIISYYMTLRPTRVLEASQGFAQCGFVEKFGGFPFSQAEAQPSELRVSSGRTPESPDSYYVSWACDRRGQKGQTLQSALISFVLDCFTGVVYYII